MFYVNHPKSSFEVIPIVLVCIVIWISKRRKLITLLIVILICEVVEMIILFLIRYVIVNMCKIVHLLVVCMIQGIVTYFKFFTPVFASLLGFFSCFIPWVVLAVSNSSLCLFKSLSMSSSSILMPNLAHNSTASHDLPIFFISSATS